MLSVSLDCPFMIAPSVFSNVYLLERSNHSCSKIMCYSTITGNKISIAIFIPWHWQQSKIAWAIIVFFFFFFCWNFLSILQVLSRRVLRASCLYDLSRVASECPVSSSCTRQRTKHCVVILYSGFPLGSAKQSNRNVNIKFSAHDAFLE